MDKDALQGWLVVVGIALMVCAFGWYSAATNNSATTSSSETSQDSSSSTASVDDYASALQEANDNIESANNCIDDASSLFDGGSFDDGMSALDSCRQDTVSEP
jgi:hypothetical protein